MEALVYIYLEVLRYVALTVLRNSVVASTRPVFLGFSLWLPITPKGFWVVFVLS